MIPIFEQGQGKGIGLSVEDFKNRFDEICQSHLRQNNAKSFAFIFYDFGDLHIRRVLKDFGVFVKLDRLASKKLSIFFLHSAKGETVREFNSQFIRKIVGHENVTLPGVVFFKLKKDKIENVTVAQLDQNNIIHAFDELYGLIDDYVSGRNTKEEKFIKLLKGAGKFTSVESFRAILRNFMDHALSLTRIIHGAA